VPTDQAACLEPPQGVYALLCRLTETTPMRAARSPQQRTDYGTKSFISWHYVLAVAVGLVTTSVKSTASHAYEGSFLPDPQLTPGAVLATHPAEVCASGYVPSERAFEPAVRDRVFARYGIPRSEYHLYELDRLVPAELGGATVDRNLWPQPYDGGWGAEKKDRLEARLRTLVCAGQLSLSETQAVISQNWIDAYRRYMPGDGECTRPASLHGMTMARTMAT
jgi:hypothetical protein